MSFNTFKRTIDVVTTTTEYADTSKDLSGSGFEVIPKILNIFKQVFKALWWVVKGAASLFWFSLENSATAETEKYDLNMDDWNTPKNKSNKSYSGEEKNYIRINGYDKQGNTVRM